MRLALQLQLKQNRHQQSHLSKNQWSHLNKHLHSHQFLPYQLHKLQSNNRKNDRLFKVSVKRKYALKSSKLLRGKIKSRPGLDLNRYQGKVRLVHSVEGELMVKLVQTNQQW